MLERWPYWHTSVPLQEEERGKSILCCLQEFTQIGESLKPLRWLFILLRTFFFKNTIVETSLKYIYCS